LEADEWLRLLRVTKELKMEYVAHQLEGKAGVRWSHHRAGLHANAVVTWDQFKTAFRDTYILLAVIIHACILLLTSSTCTIVIIFCRYYSATSGNVPYHEESTK